MKQSSFTAQELFAMAFLMNKQKMYGIPDVMGQARTVALQEALDGLVAQGVADMNIDGQIHLREDYHRLVDSYCDCNRCLTVNVRKQTGAEESVIFWLYDSSYFMAEVMDEHYVFSRADAETVSALITQALYKEHTEKSDWELVIPQTELLKARRACIRGKLEEATQILRQNGAGVNVASFVIQGLQKNAYYFGVVSMLIENSACEKKDLTYLVNDNSALRLDQTVANLRTCAKFSSVSSEEMQHTVKTLVDEFMQGGE